MFLFKKHKKITKKGFTLIEMMVAVFVFSAVMVIAVGAIFSIVSANKTSQALKSVLDNLNSAMDSMSREIRYGTNYHCENAFLPAGECDSSGFTFTPKPDSNGVVSGGDTTYRFDSPSAAIYVNNTGDQQLTASEVVIQDMKFYVKGNDDDPDSGQPRVLITISGYAKSGLNKSYFNLETMVTQRAMVCTKYKAADSTRNCTP